MRSNKDFLSPITPFSSPADSKVNTTTFIWSRMVIVNDLHFSNLEDSPVIIKNPPRYFTFSQRHIDLSKNSKPKVLDFSIRETDFELNKPNLILDDSKKSSVTYPSTRV